MSPSRLSVVALAVLAACDVTTTPPDVVTPLPSFAKTGACASATTVVSSEDELNASLTAALPGDVIGVQGTLSLSHSVVVWSPGITITCATPGAGLQAAPDQDIFEVYAPNVTITSLNLDAAQGSGAVYGWRNDGAYNGDAIHVTANVVECGWYDCVFLPSIRNAVIADNRFTASVPTGTGVHIQFDAAGAVVTGNTIITKVPSGDPLYGAIRVRDAKDVVIRDNVIEGPWSNGIAVTDLFDADIGGNRITGPAEYGLRIITGPLAGGTIIGPFPVGANLYHNNSVAGAGGAGFGVLAACGDVFRGNRLGGNAVSAAFGPSTGNNVFLGNGDAVSDEGAFDCDGDGRNDPNAITGPRMKTAHVNIGRLIRELNDASGGNVLR